MKTPTGEYKPNAAENLEQEDNREWQEGRERYRSVEKALKRCCTVNEIKFRLRKAIGAVSNFYNIESGKRFSQSLPQGSHDTLPFEMLYIGERPAVLTSLALTDEIMEQMKADGLEFFDTDPERLVENFIFNRQKLETIYSEDEVLQEYGDSVDDVLSKIKAERAERIQRAGAWVDYSYQYHYALGSFLGYPKDDVAEFSFIHSKVQWFINTFVDSVVNDYASRGEELGDIEGRLFGAESDDVIDFLIANLERFDFPEESQKEIYAKLLDKIKRQKLVHIGDLVFSSSEEGHNLDEIKNRRIKAFKFMGHNVDKMSIN
jgi:hypothetical protein